MQKKIVIILILMAAATMTFAQSSSKKKKKDKEEDDQEMPTTLDPNKKQKTYEPKKSKKNISHGPTFESDDEYRKRMEAVVKQKRKDERYEENPQYSDPMYFGHKRPP